MQSKTHIDMTVISTLLPRTKMSETVRSSVRAHSFIEFYQSDTYLRCAQTVLMDGDVLTLMQLSRETRAIFHRRAPYLLRSDAYVDVYYHDIRHRAQTLRVGGLMIPPSSEWYDGLDLPTSLLRLAYFQVSICESSAECRFTIARALSNRFDVTEGRL